MRPKPVFSITYWGVTGTLSAPLRPAEVTDKLVRAMTGLVERGRLHDLAPGPELDALLRRAVAEELPFHMGSTYGGNTTCLEVRTPDALLILDCGSGLRELGIDLEARWRRDGAAAVRRAHVLVSHPHMDHTFGTSSFLPYFDPANAFTIWSTWQVLDSLAVLLDPQSSLSRVYFPLTYEQMKALKELRPVAAGEHFTLGSTQVRTYALHHPGGCLAYRLDNAGRSFVFATDHEHQEVPDRGLAAFARGADLLYTEGQFTRAEYEGREGVGGGPPMSRRGWGHSPVEACVATAVAAGVRELHLGHRDPQRDDAGTAALETYARGLLREELIRSGRPEDACQLRIPHEGLRVDI